MEVEVDLLRTNFETIKSQGHQFTHTFYDALFASSPEMKALFETADVAEQYTKFLRGLTLVIRNLEKPDFLQNYLTALGRTLLNFGIKPEHSKIAGRCLLEALQVASGNQWSGELEAAWSKAYNSAVDIMLRGTGAIAAV
jgi:hemoglobin-like flavoprotein